MVKARLVSAVGECVSRGGNVKTAVERVVVVRAKGREGEQRAVEHLAVAVGSVSYAAVCSQC